MYDGAGITGLGGSKLYAKMSMTVLVLGATVFSFCAAHVFESNVSLLVASPIMIAFFTSLALVFLAIMCSLIFCIKLTNVGEYDLPIKLPAGEFDYGGNLVNKGGYVQSNSVRAEIMMNRELQKGVLGFSPISAVCFSVLGMMLCTCSAALGIMLAREGSVKGVLDAFFSADPGLVGRLCVVTASIALGLLVASTLRYAMCSHGSYIFVLNDGVRKLPTKSVEYLADKLNVDASNVVHVRVHRVSGEPGVMMDNT